MKLIFIHGRAQQGKDPVQLQKEWEDTWQKGLDRAGLQRPPSIQAAFPFYGDELDKLLKELDAPMVEDVVYRGAGSLTVSRLLSVASFSMRCKDAGVSDAEIQAHYKGLPQEKGPLNWGWVQAILQALDRTPLGGGNLRCFYSRCVCLFDH
ncbi:MAG: hypothetical protein U0Y68_15675 [Blastocatellia bacterium]